MTHTSNKPIVAAMIIIGIVILVILLMPRYGSRTLGYTYRNALSANALGAYPTAYPAPYYYSNVPIQDIHTGYTTYTVKYNQPAPVTTTTYPTTKTYTTYSYETVDTGNNQTYYLDGCNAYTNFSTTTGYACDGSGRTYYSNF